MAFLSDKEDRELLESIQNGNTQETVLSAPKSRLISRCILLVSVVLVVFQLYTAFFGSFQSLIQRPVHVFLGSMLIFLYQMQKNDRTTLFKKLDVGVCWVGILIALVGCVYIVKNMKAIMHPNFSISSFECVLAILILLLVLDCARRSIGMAIPIMAIIAIGYAMFGKYIPGTWGHNGITFRNLLTTLVYSDRGVWGSITGTSATIIATFVIFGSVLFSTGGGQTFIDAANALTGRATGGAAKLATISSALFGTVSGSAGANVATTGAFTIPMMKRLGYKKEFAAAVECSASSGGQIMPPVMGAGAFIMADLLGMPYLGIAAAAVLPAVMYYLGVFVAIDCAARRYHYKGLAEEDILRGSENGVLRHGRHAADLDGILGEGQIGLGECPQVPHIHAVARGAARKNHASAVFPTAELCGFLRKALEHFSERLCGENKSAVLMNGAGQLFCQRDLQVGRGDGEHTVVAVCFQQNTLENIQRGVRRRDGRCALYCCKQLGAVDGYVQMISSFKRRNRRSTAGFHPPLPPSTSASSFLPVFLRAALRRVPSLPRPAPIVCGCPHQ